MKTIKKIAMVAAAVGGFAAATPSQAVITTFATYNSTTTARNIRWLKTGTTSGQIFTIATNNGTAPGSVPVFFSFLQAGFGGAVSNVHAIFNFVGTTAGNPATLSAGNLDQKVDSGTFSFRSTSAITVGSTTYAPGSNLLTGVYTNSTISGRRFGTSGSDSASTMSGSAITYTSDFLDFSTTINRDFSLALTAIGPSLNAISGQSLNSFRASSAGNFSSDPAPLVNGVPEPAVWGLMIAGFGIVGFQSRRRRGIKAVTA